MKVESIDLVRCALPLRRAWVAGAANQTARDALLVRISTDVGVGWGECSAMNAPTYTSEFTDASILVIRDHLAPRLLRADDVHAATVRSTMEEVVGHQMAKSALEMAVVDAELRARGESLAHHLGVERARVPAGAAVGMGADDPTDQGDLLETVEPLAADGYRRIKLKIRPGNDRQRIEALHRAFPGIEVQVDANGAYPHHTEADIVALDWIDDVDVSLIEQPFPPTELGAHRRLAHRLVTPICLDEPITHLGAARDAIASEACEVMNLKIGRVGGLTTAIEIHDLCVRSRVPIWIGGMLDTGIGRAVNAVCSGLPGITMTGDLSASTYHYERDVIEAPIVVRDGWIDVPTEPGIGATVDESALAALTRDRLRVGPDGPDRS